MALPKGGLDGIRDFAAIEAAIARPYVGYYRLIPGKGAASVHSIAFNHGFADANKRTTIYTLLLFLNRGGYEIRAASAHERDKSLEEMILAVVERRMDFDALVA